MRASIYWLPACLFFGVAIGTLIQSKPKPVSTDIDFSKDVTINQYLVRKDLPTRFTPYAYKINDEYRSLRDIPPETNRWIIRIGQNVTIYAEEATPMK